MKVGELIDLLEPFRGRGDDVIMEDDDLHIYKITGGTYWDDVAKVIVIKTEYVG